MTSVDIETVPDVDLNAEIPCSFRLPPGSCPHPARWIPYIACGAHGNPACDSHKEEYGLYLLRHSNYLTIFCNRGHQHRVPEVQWREL